MDIYEYIKMDHQKVDDLLNLLEKSKIRERRLEILEMITQELIVHLESEQNTFYAILESHRKSKDETLHDHEEHLEIENLLAQIIEKPKPDDVKWENQLKELIKLIKHHVKDEEGTIFKKAKEVISEKDSYKIKEMMHDYKEKLLAKFEKA